MQQLWSSYFLSCITSIYITLTQSRRKNTISVLDVISESMVASSLSNIKKVAAMMILIQRCVLLILVNYYKGEKQNNCCLRTKEIIVCCLLTRWLSTPCTSNIHKGSFTRSMSHEKFYANYKTSSSSILNGPKFSIEWLLLGDPYHWQHSQPCCQWD